MYVGTGLNIPLATLAEQPKLAIVIDGADEVDPELNVVKGRGGALLREKVRPRPVTSLQGTYCLAPQRLDVQHQPGCFGVCAL